MQLISCHNGRLITTAAAEAEAASRVIAAGAQNRAFATGMNPLDAIAPNERLARGAVHELLAHPDNALPAFVAMVLAKAASCSTGFQPANNSGDHGSGSGSGSGNGNGSSGGAI